MASDYSDNLRIELISTGEQAGAWGTTTNRNLGTLIEQAISGSVAVTTVATDTALTALNGVEDQARNMMLVLNTSSGGDFNVYVPPAPKIYIVSNVSGYVVTLYNSTIIGNIIAAGDGISVPAGVNLLVYTDGINFKTINAANLTDTLAVANGGTGSTSLAANNVILGNGTSAVQTVAPGTVGNVLVSDGATWTSGVGVPSGSLFMWPTGTAPTGYLLCDGTTYNEGDYSALFGVIGRTFGGDAVAGTFNVPDYRDRMPIGAGTSYSANSTGGNKDAIVVLHSHTGSTSSAGSHEHYLARADYWTGGLNSSNYIAQIESTGTPNDYTLAGHPSVANIGRSSAAGSHSHSVTVNDTGAGGTNANLPPYLGIYFIIKT